MKLNIFSVFILVAFFCKAQTSITSFDSAPASNYALVESSPAIDQSSSGANLVWNFTNLSLSGTTSIDSYATPSAQELIDYPGTTSVLTTNETPTTNVRKLYTNDSTGDISITGFLTDILVLNFITDNAEVGTFPLNYSYNNLDNVSGTFSFDTQSIGVFVGTFTGTINVDIDAYGTLQMNDLGSGAYNGNVTRLKMVQNLDLSLANGNLIVTSHNYYDNTTGDLVFRTVDTSVTSDFYNTSISLMESLQSGTLGTSYYTPENNKLSFEENPVKDYLKFNFLNPDSRYFSISILDMNGRQILKSENQEDELNVENLRSGIYLFSATTNEGVFSKKFIKL